MFSSPVTLVVITPGRLIRADFASARADSPESLVVRERPEIDDPATLVETALGSARRKPGRTFVLSSDLWSNFVALNSAVTQGMPDGELRQLLGFEAEPLSGNSPFETTTAAVPAGEADGRRNFWVTQINTFVRDEIDAAVRRAGGRLSGVLQTAGVDPGDARENAGDVAGRVHSEPDARFNYDALEEGELKQWLGDWLGVLTARAPQTPVVPPPPRKFTKQQQMAIAAVLAVIAAGGCYGYHRWVDSRLAAVAAEKIELEAPGQEVAALKQQAGEVDKELKKVRDERDKLAANVKVAEQAIDSHRRRLASLLRRLSDDASKDWVLQKIEGSGRELTLVGTTMHPKHINKMADEMATDLADLGWVVELPKQQDRSLAATGGPWTFELELRDALSPATTPDADAEANFAGR